MPTVLAAITWTCSSRRPSSGIAAEADKPDVLPDDDTLHRWARSALGRTKFGELLVSLAWAFDRRGDDDMARHLLAEAPSRIPRWSLDKTAPRLNAWATTTAAAWKMDLGFYSLRLLNDDLSVY